MFWTEGELLECHIKEARRLASTTQYDLFGALSCLELAVSLQSFSPLCLWKKLLACFSSFFFFFTLSLEFLHFPRGSSVK